MRILPLLSILLLLTGASAGAVPVITFDELPLANGQVVDTDFAGLPGPTIANIIASNVGGGPDLAVLFDSLATGTRDPDLEGPNWAVGNTDLTQSLGNLLILQENSTGCGDDVCDLPDDEGSRAAGVLELVLSEAVLSFGIDLIDIEDSGPSEPGSFTFFDDAGASQVTVSWSELEAGGAFDQGAVFGNNSLNRIAPITAASLGLSGIDRVAINLGGSGAIDNVVLGVNEPATLALLASGVSGLLWMGRRRSS
ncbi:MAG: hypothetical protein QNK05_09835 [Myxococcota bacterium]|nr:hypothetical protein [Myxococcota bacterium]